VVACPPSMLLQWQEEMETRFGLAFEVLDKAYVARVRQERGYGVNPWLWQSFTEKSRSAANLASESGPYR